MRIQLTVVWLVAILFGGCAPSDRVSCYPVQGSVVYQSKPLAEAMVVFHSLDTRGAKKSSVTYTDASGNFSLTTDSPGDGLPAGKYGVTIELRAPQLIGEETTRTGRNLLPARYAKPETSGLQFTVEPTSNTFPPLQIADR